MSPQTWQRVKSLYATALELPSDRRADYLRREAAEEPKVLSEALRLLRHEDAPSSRLDALQVPAGLLTKERRGSLLPGERLNDRYEISRFIAQGGFGEVYEADDLEKGERIAVKLFRPEFATADHLSWLRREVQMARKVQHPNICRVFDFVQTPRAAFLTMELLDGETLASYLRREGALSERRALPFVRQIVAALAAAHANGVIHRDLKPGNIMLVPRPDGPLRVVVTDFGLARQSSDDRRTTVAAQSSTAAFGTPAYMAPEQIYGRPPGPAADIYSLGVVLHELLTGELPFANDSPLAVAVRKTRETPTSPIQLAPTLRPTWERCILRCLAPKPEDRFADVREVLTFLDSRSSTVIRWKLARRAIRRHARTRNIVAAATAVALLVFVFVFWPRTPAPDQVKQWERGLFSLHAGEPLLAVQAWEQAPPQINRLHADLALAWLQLKLPSRARQHLANSPRLFATHSDRQYRQAVSALIDGDPKSARDILQSRAAANPTDGILLADLAYFESIQDKKPSPTWDKVVTLRTDHAGAFLHLAALRAAEGEEQAAERAFLSAQNYFNAHNQPDLVRAVASRRGLFRLAAGHTDAAKNDLASLTAASIPDTGAGRCEHKLLIQSGINDDFAAPPDPIPFLSPRFQLMPALANGAKPGTFDQVPMDTFLALSIPLPPVRICSGQLLVSMRRENNLSGSSNDEITIGAAPFNNSDFAPLRRSLWAGYATTMKGGINIELTPELFANVQRTYANEPQAFLDIHAADDTDFDFITLLIVY